jgi:hypothetical protein
MFENRALRSVLVPMSKEIMGGWRKMHNEELQKRGKWKTLLNMIVNLLVSYNVGEFLSSCITGGFTKWAQLHGVSYAWTAMNVSSSTMPCIKKSGGALSCCSYICNCVCKETCFTRDRNSFCKQLKLPV